MVNLVDSPNISLCTFDKKFLKVPKEILTLTMETHQKYFPTFNNKDELTNEFLIVANKKDQKGLIKIGNERVGEARFSDAEFFWKEQHFYFVLIWTCGRKLLSENQTLVKTVPHIKL